MRHRGFTLTEMLWALILLSVVAALGTQVVWRSITAIMAERSAAAANASRSSFVQRVRKDVWNATSIKAVDGSLVLAEGDSEVRYTCDDERVRRSAGGQEMQWPVQHIKFAAGAAMATVQLGPDDSLAMAAPRLMTGGTR